MWEAMEIRLALDNSDNEELEKEDEEGEEDLNDNFSESSTLNYKKIDDNE